MNKSSVNVAILGATGAVGECMVKVLQQRDFPVGHLYLLASRRSAGQQVNYGGQSFTVTDAADFDFAQAELGLFSAGADVSAEYVPRAVAAGCVVIDNTSCFRYDQHVPLLIPEVNPHAIHAYRAKGIIANPNCSTIQMLVALAPLHKKYQLRRVNVASYQAVSGTGKPAISELLEQSRAILAGAQHVSSSVYPKQIAFNALPHIDTFQDNAYSKEEMKMVWETRKILADDSILVNPTAVRVAVTNAHSEAIHAEFVRTPVVAEVRALLQQAPGVTVIDDCANNAYPTAVDADGRDEVFVGRIRADISHPQGLNLWVVSDNLRKGAATNSVQIAECLLDIL